MIHFQSLSQAAQALSVRQVGQLFQFLPPSGGDYPVHHLAEVGSLQIARQRL